MSAKTCGHPACSCPVDTDELYCSATCREAAGQAIEEVDGCGCRHSECLGAAGSAGDGALQGEPEETPD